VERGLDGQVMQPELGVDHRVPPQPDRRLITPPATTTAPGLALFHPSSCGRRPIAELSGELGLVCAPALREQLLGLLRPRSSRLVIDLSKVSHCDASGLAVLIGTGRRAGFLGGFLRLAAVSPQVDQGLYITGLRQHLGVFPTVQAATASPQSPRGKEESATAGVLDPIAGGGLKMAGSRSGDRQPDLASCFLPAMFSAIELFRPSPGMMTHATR
jgi:anti-anti-sigma factor